MILTKQKYLEIPLRIKTFSHDGRGIAQHEGKTVFVHGALPGEEVICKITKKHPRYLEGTVTSITHGVKERIEPTCSHFGVCGGCSMQHLTTQDQLLLKQKILLEQLKHFGKVAPDELMEPLSGNPWGYRRKARLGVKYVIKKGKVLVGFREKCKAYLADIETCPVLHPLVGTKLLAMNKMVSELTQYQHIPQIEVAVGENATALVIRQVVPLPEGDLMRLTAFGKNNNFHIYLHPNPPARPYKLWPDDGEESLRYTLPAYKIEFSFHPLAFTQINHEMNQLMIQKTISLLEPTQEDDILDLFCGLGNFTLPIARFAKKVTGVEISLEMVETAKKNAERNQLFNVHFFSANLMAKIEPAPFLQQYDKIVLDPPRSGAQEIIAKIPTFSPKKIVYVSCNPATLARDAGELVHVHQFKLRRVGLINMFPHTSHIEAIAEFTKR